MDTREILQTFFEAENRRDWDLYRKFIGGDVCWNLYSKGQIKTIIGDVDQCINLLRQERA